MALYKTQMDVSEIEYLPENEKAEIKQKLHEAELLIDHATSQPYKIVDGVRYNLEPLFG